MMEGVLQASGASFWPNNMDGPNTYDGE